MDVESLLRRNVEQSYGFPLLQRVEIESGTSPDNLLLRADVRSVRNAGPLNRLLADYQGPRDMAGTRLLLLEDKPSHYECFAWVKKLRRVRRLPIVREDPVLGTGLVLEDLLSRRVEDWEAKLLREGENGVEIELTPRSYFASAYERLVGTFRAGPAPALLSLDYHRKGRKEKTLRIDLATGTSTLEGPGRLFTVMKIVEFTRLPSVRDEVFSVSSLARSVRIGDERI